MERQTDTDRQTPRAKEKSNVEQSGEGRETRKNEIDFFSGDADLLTPSASRQDQSKNVRRDLNRSLSSEDGRSRLVKCIFHLIRPATGEQICHCWQKSNSDQDDISLLFSSLLLSIDFLFSRVMFRRLFVLLLLLLLLLLLRLRLRLLSICISMETKRKEREREKRRMRKRRHR